MEDLIDDRAEDAEAPRRIIAFAGPKQGVGKTAVAVNLALGWAGIQKRKVVIIQLDGFRRQELGFLLGTEAPQSLVGLARDLRGKPPAPGGIEVPTHWGVGGLTLAAEKNDPTPLDPQELIRLLQALQERYDLFLDVDPGSPLGDFALDVADLVFWVTRPSLVYTEATFDRFTDLRCRLFRPEEFEIVVNQAGVPGALSRVELDGFFATMGKKVLSYMPWEDLLPEFANVGKCLIVEKPAAPWVEALRPLLGRLLKAPPKPKPFKVWTPAEFQRSASFYWAPERPATPLPSARAASGIPARVAAFIGPRDGTGKTTVCLNLALAWAAWKSRKTVIVQLDPLCGTEVGFLLGLAAIPSLASVARKMRAVPDDPSIWLKGLPISPWGVAFLRFAENATERAALSPADVVGVLRALHREYDLFLDVGPDPGLQAFAASVADIVYSVTLPLRVHLETTCSQFLASPALLAAVPKCEFVVNGCDLPGAFTPEDMERFFSTLGKRALSRLPWEEKLPQLANSGKIWAVEKPDTGWTAGLKPLLGQLGDLVPVGAWDEDLAERLLPAARPVRVPAGEQAPALPQNLIAAAMDRERLWIREDPRHDGRPRAGLERIVGGLLLERPSPLPRIRLAQQARALVDSILGLEELAAVSRRTDPITVRSLFERYSARVSAKMAPFVYYVFAESAAAAGDPVLAAEIFGRFIAEDIDYKDARRRFREMQALHSAPPAPGLPAKERPATPPTAPLSAARPPASAPAPASPAAPAGLLGGRIEVRGRIGEGGVGPVYDGRDREPVRRVAVKVLRPEIQRSPKELARFLTAAKVVGGLSGPGIVRLIEVVTDGTGTRLIYEFAEGETLAAQLAARGRLHLDECRILFSDIYQALDRAHHAGLLHRGLKPSNVMIGPDGAARVMDFVLSREARDMAVRLNVPALAGTPAYLAPEQHRGEAGAPADVFALGVMLYEMLTGELPFPDPAPLSQKMQHRYAPARASLPELPAAVDELLAEALAPDPARRIASASAFYDRLYSL